MKVLIQDLATRLYLGANEQWVRPPGKALNFRGSLAAIDFCFKRKMFGVQILLVFPNPTHNIRLDIFSTARKRAPCRNVEREQPFKGNGVARQKR